MTKNKNKSNRKYRFCGNGDGVAGLPHEIDEQTAEVRGVLKILTAALRNGSYKEISPTLPSPNPSDLEREAAVINETIKTVQGE